jgi:hypothetical protein
MKTPPCFEDQQTKPIIRQICEEHNIDLDLLKDLCEEVNSHAGSGRRFGLPENIDAILDRFVKRTKEV